MDDKERVQAYISLYKQQMERYTKTQDIEWKGNFGIWTLLAGAIYLAATRPTTISRPLAGSVLIVLTALHCGWLWAVHSSGEIDKGLWVEYRGKALLLLDARSSASSKHKRPFWKELVWLCLEVGVTAVLSLILYAVLFWQASGAKPAA